MAIGIPKADTTSNKIHAQRRIIQTPIRLIRMRTPVTDCDHPEERPAGGEEDAKHQEKEAVDSVQYDRNIQGSWSDSTRLHHFVVPLWNCSLAASSSCGGFFGAETQGGQRGPGKRQTIDEQPLVEADRPFEWQGEEDDRRQNCLQEQESIHSLQLASPGQPD